MDPAEQLITQGPPSFYGVGERKSSMKWTDNPMFDLSPSFLEVQAAKAVFLKKLQQNQQYTRYQPGTSLYMSPETVVACALAEVWRQGRKYQRDQDSAALMELAGMGARI